MRIAPTALLLLASLAHVRSSQQAFNKLLSTGDVGATAREWSWVNCGDPTDAILLHSIEVSPDPPVPGKDLTITVKGTVNEVIKEGAYADVVVKIGLVKLLQKRFDVCGEAKNANASITCPVEAGEHTVVQTVPLPREIPPAKFTVQVRGYTANEEGMLCVDLKASFMP
ncbi:ML domain-containing protein [Mycena metata]|uniref:Phosphatidylglycerol/phosphatidylinositol transfer protein n=1 Tax=Mycena metata TaxID=1033252 RepID=A0AAD7JM33_9AGAR|nr:ML domain-containing protein [Mycena metata]